MERAANDAGAQAEGKSTYGERNAQIRKCTWEDVIAATAAAEVFEIFALLCLGLSCGTWDLLIFYCLVFFSFLSCGMWDLQLHPVGYFDSSVRTLSCSMQGLVP